MKKLILITVLFMGIISYSYSQEQEIDTIFSVRIETDTMDYYSVYLVFENISNDSILLISSFRNFLWEFRHGPGFRINFYFDHKLGLPNWGESPPNNYIYSNGETFFAPHSIVKIPINLPYFGKLKNNIEYGLVFELNYRYFNLTQGIGKYFYHIETDYFKLDYLKIYED
jgi:hypothetical protein